MLLDKNQQQGVAEQRGLPVEVVSDAQRVVPIPAETLVFEFYSAGVLTTDAGEAAGTVVVIKLANGGILNAVGDVIGQNNDTSFAFGTGTILTTRVDFPYLKAELHDRNTGTLKASEITSTFSNGDWCLDHRTGTIYGLKATTGASDTATYKISVQQASSGGGVSGSVDITKIGGDTVPGTPIFDEDTAHVSGDAGQHMLTVRDDAPVAKAGTDGDYQSLTTDAVGALWAILRGYDSSSDSNKGFEVAPIWSNHLEETLADVTNETSATNYYYVDMDGYQYFSLDANTSGATPTDTLTVTIEAGNQDDGTAAASIFYQDVTQAWFGVASVVDADFRWERDTPVGAKFIRIKTVTAGGSNDADYALYLKKWY